MLHILIDKNSLGLKVSKHDSLYHAVKISRQVIRMASNRAPKQWSLSKDETITSFEAWRQNLLYILSLDPNFAHFLLEETTWQRKTSNQPTRGSADDGEDVPGQIANFCPVVARNTIVKNSTSMQSIWQAIRAHFGFQSTGARFLDFNYLHLEPGERPEDLYQRL